MTGIVTAIFIVLINGFWEWEIFRRAEKRSGTESIGYVLKWNSLRIFALISSVVGVILLANLELISFTLSFFTFYVTSLIYTAFRYGTT